LLTLALPHSTVVSLMSKKKGGNNEEHKWDKDLEPFVKLLLGKKGIKRNVRSATYMQSRKVDYFAGRHFKKWINQKDTEELLNDKCSGALTKSDASYRGKEERKTNEDDKDIMKEKDMMKLGQELINCGFITKAASSNKPASSSSTGKEKKNRPDKLVPSQSKVFDKDAYYVIEYEGDSSWQHFLLACIIVGVLLVCMWPVWPIWAKIGIWYLSVIFLSLYFGVLILRAVVYTLFWVVGFDFWIFPNLNDEYAGVWESFKPFYSWEKRQDDLIMLLVRFGSLAIVAVAVEQISQTCSLSDFSELVTHSYTDLLDWGVDKILALPGSQRETILSLEELKKDLGDDEGNASDNASFKNVESVAPGADADEDDDDVPEVTVH